MLVTLMRSLLHSTLIDVPWMMQSTYKFVTNVTETFDGDGEKSYPRFYDCVSGDEIVSRIQTKGCQ